MREQRAKYSRILPAGKHTHSIAFALDDARSSQAYPSLHIGNIVRLDTVLRFENWCELISPIDANGNNVHRCKKSNGMEEAVQPFRCLYMSSKREEITVPALDCSMNSIIGTGECFRPEKWQQLASIECANKSMSLNNSIMTLDWCGLSSFRGIEFVCCSSKKPNDNDYETSVDEQDDSPLVEDDPIVEPAHRRIIAMTLATRKHARHPRSVEPHSLIARRTELDGGLPSVEYRLGLLRW